MNLFQKREINALAQLFYRMMGYTVEDGYDFSKAKHPTEKMVWVQAKVSMDFWWQRWKLDEEGSGGKDE